MPDLVEKYFGADLTLSEQESLSSLLLESDEAALKFESLAKDAYLRYGLPDPQPRWKDAPPPSMGGKGWSLGWWMGLPIVVAVAWLALDRGWMGILGSGPREGDRTGPRVVERTGSMGKPAGSGARPRASRPGKSAAPGVLGTESSLDEELDRDLASSEPGRDAAREPLSKASAGSSSSNRSQPIAVEPGASPSFTNLSVVVEQDGPGEVTVRVADAGGSGVVTLYQGPLAKGTWAFEWDGLLPGDRPAQAGVYQIEVRMGPFVQRKPVQIE